ncbi:MAG TPA: aminotransferase class I/II-fold pyridoxal phosphate-dependent enzyme [Acidobacteriota bacterium]|nr:aminotransferase class I/II-fold pyridoxal phosphate-dependent enzyme [Acidobacteriota bacterium]
MDRRRFLMGTAAGLAALKVMGCQPRDPQAASDGTPLLRLDSNENPLGLASSGREALIEGLGEANRYPGDIYPKLREMLAEGLGISVESLVTSGGSAELLVMAAAAFSRVEGGTVLQGRPTFLTFSAQAKARGVTVREFDLAQGHAYPLDAMRQAAEETEGPVLVYVCNPNNPTGTVISSDAVARWIEEAPEDTWFLIDEAYHEFVRDERYRTLVAEATQRPRTLVTRTFSKIYAMAGLRIGYGVAHPETAEQLAGLTQWGNVNHAAACAAMGCYRDDEYLRRSFESNQQARSILTTALDEMGLEYLSSQTNFVFHRIPGKVEDHIEKMQEQGVLVGRPFPPLLNWNRVSLGLPQEMERFVEALKKVV